MNDWTIDQIVQRLLDDLQHLHSPSGIHGRIQMGQLTNTIDPERNGEQNKLMDRIIAKLNRREQHYLMIV